MAGQALISSARLEFLAALLQNVLTAKTGVPSNADKDSAASVAIATGILNRVGQQQERDRLAGQSSGHQFEDIAAAFLRNTFLKLGHLRPGDWSVIRAGEQPETGPRSKPVTIANYEQYAHLTALSLLAKKDRQLAAALRSDYAIRPDILIVRQPETDDSINAPRNVVDGITAGRTSLRAKNNPLPLLHGCISCKWTIRSDRVQNARSEGLNLIRNRKGRVPHIAVLTGEPMPSRIAAIALGTGDIDCVYHFALPELLATLDGLSYPDARELLEIMVEGKRLRDISDLPLDLAI